MTTEPESELTNDPLIPYTPLRNAFYRDGYRRVLVLCLLLILILAGLIAFIYFQKIMEPKQTFYATSLNGGLTSLQPLATPNLSANALIAWAAEAATAVFNYDFLHYNDTLQKAQGYFTPEGYQQMLSALDSSGSIAILQEKKLVVTAIPTAAAVITQQGLLNNVYYWTLEIPMAVSYQSGTEFSPRNIIIKMNISRVPTTESPKGIGIAQFVVNAGTFS